MLIFFQAIIQDVEVVFTSDSPKQSTLLVAQVNDVPCVFQVADDIFEIMFPAFMPIFHSLFMRSWSC